MANYWRNKQKRDFFIVRRSTTIHNIAECFILTVSFFFFLSNLSYTLLLEHASAHKSYRFVSFVLMRVYMLLISVVLLCLCVCMVFGIDSGMCVLCFEMHVPITHIFCARIECLRRFLFYAL